MNRCGVHQDCLEHAALAQSCLHAHLETLPMICVSDRVRVSWLASVKTGQVEQIWGGPLGLTFLVRIYMDDNIASLERLHPALGLVRLERLP